MNIVNYTEYILLILPVITLFLSFLYKTSFPTLFCYTIYLTYCFYYINPIMAFFILSVGILTILFSFEKKNNKFSFVQKEKKSSIDKKEINTSKKKINTNKKNDLYNKDIIESIKEKIEKDKFIKFSELAKIWLPENTENFKQKKQEIKNGNLKVEKEEKIKFLNNNTVSEVSDNIVENNKNNENIEDRKEIIFTNNFVNSIFNEFVKDSFFNNEHKEIAISILKLLDKVANEPSITDIDEEDKKNYESYYDVLKQVTLAEHTYNTVKFAFELIKKEFTDTWKISWDGLCLAAISHDLGKAQNFRSSVVFYSSHKEISKELFINTYREMFESNKINLPEEKIKRISDIILFHHGTPPDSYAKDKTLELLKKADNLARKKELEAELGTVKTWNNIDSSALIQEIYNRMKTKAFSKDAANRIYFIIDEKKNLIFIHKDLIFMETLREFLKKHNIFWQELNSKDELTFLNSMKLFFNTKIKPLDIYPSSDSSIGKVKSFFYFVNVEKNGKLVGLKPFIPFILPVFAKLVNVSSNEIVELYKESPLALFSVVYQKN